MSGGEVARAHAVAVATLLNELHSPLTAAARRGELQGIIHRERELAAADEALRSLWRHVLITHGGGELVLWFALSSAESQLRHTAIPRIPPSERAALKQALIGMLLGADAASLPPSARSKGVAVLAQLARASWPAEDPSLLGDMLALLKQAGAPRAIGARLLAAVAEEFSAADARRPAAGVANQREHSERRALFIGLLPQAYAALTEALRDEAAMRDAPAIPDAAGAAATSGGSTDGAALCLEAARSLLVYGRSRDGLDVAARAFTPEEVLALPALLHAACAFLSPAAANEAAAGDGHDRQHHRPSVSALLLLAELSELRDPRAGELIAPLVEPVTQATQRLAAEGAARRAAAATAAPSAALLPYGLTEDGLDELEAALSTLLDSLCTTWLLRLAPSAAPPLLVALWAHSQAASASQLRRFVRLCNHLLSASYDELEGLYAAVVVPLADALLGTAPELLSRVLLSRSARAAEELADEAEEAWSADDAIGGGGGGGGTSLLAVELSSMWRQDGLGGGGGSVAAADARPAGAEESDNDDGLAPLLDAIGEFFGHLSRATTAARRSEVANLLADALSALLPPLRASTTIHVPHDVHTVAELLEGQLASIAAAIASSAAAARPLIALVELLVGALGGEAPHPPSTSRLIGRAEIAILRLLKGACEALVPIHFAADATAARSPHTSPAGAAPASPAAGETSALAHAITLGVRTLVAHAMALLPLDAGGAAVSCRASDLLLEATSFRWPGGGSGGATNGVGGLVGGFPQLVALAASAGGDTAGAPPAAGGSGGAFIPQLVAARVPAACWPSLAAAAAMAILIAPRGVAPAEYEALHLTPPCKAALLSLLTALTAPLAAPPADTASINASVGAPATCLCAVVTAARDATQEARTALDGALRAALLHEALQAALASLPLLSPPPLGAICSLLRLLRGLTRAVGSSSMWGSPEAARWVLNAALQSVRVAAGARACSRAEREGTIELALDLVHAAASERRGGSGGGARELVAQILDACGPDALGALLATGGGAEGHAAGGSDSEMLLSPPLREQLLGLAGALVANHWSVLKAAEPSLVMVARLLGAGLTHPSDAPAFRCCLSAADALHKRAFAGGRAQVGAAAAALLRGGLGGGAGGGGLGGAAPFTPSAAVLDELGRLRCLVLAARLDPSCATLHDEAAEALGAMAKAAAGGGGSADGDELSRATAAGIVAVAERCLAAEAHWLDAALSRGLLSDLSSSDMGDQLSFKSALARLANDLGCHRAEAAQTERGVAGVLG